MTQEEITKKIKSLRKNLKFIDTIVYQDYKTHKGNINRRQIKLFQGMLDLFQELDWNLQFSAYKELKIDKECPPYKQCIYSGKAVHLRSCRTNDDNEKTYFGIYLGDIALIIQHEIDENGNVTAYRTMYNPAIFVPELNDIVYGCESFWGVVESEEEMNKLITDEMIQNVWYVKALKESFKKDKE